MKTANIVRAYLCTTEEVESLRFESKLGDLVDGLSVFLDKLEFDTKEIIVPNLGNTRDDIVTEIQGTIDTLAMDAGGTVDWDNVQYQYGALLLIFELEDDKEKEYHAVAFTNFKIQEFEDKIGQRLKGIKFTASDVIKLGVKEDSEFNEMYDIILD